MCTNLDLAWLAGIVDGEGSLCLYPLTTNRGCRYIRPILSITNTDLKILKKCKDLLDVIIGSDVRIKNKGGKELYVKNPHYKQGYEILVSKHESILKVCSAIEQYLVGKKEQAHLLIDFVKIRQTVSISSKKDSQFKSYSHGEFDLMDKCISLNHPKSVETNTSNIER